MKIALVGKGKQTDIQKQMQKQGLCHCRLKSFVVRTKQDCVTTLRKFQKLKRMVKQNETHERVEEIPSDTYIQKLLDMGKGTERR